jgi:dihydrofolate reductase
MASWKNARVARGDLAEEIKTLKAETDKVVLAHGGASFCQSLVSRRLVDELRLIVHPVAIGKGLALFAGLARSLPLSLVSSTQFHSGVFANVYRPAT